MFAALPVSLQCHMLLRIVDNTKNVLEQCRLSLLVLQRYPDRIPEHGVNILVILYLQALLVAYPTCFISNIFVKDNSLRDCSFVCSGQTCRSASVR